MPPYREEVLQPVPPSDLSLKKLRDALPPHLFERKLFKSMLYLVHDIIIVTTIFAVTYYWLEYLCPSFLYWPTVFLYALVQGTAATGLWVIGHECGHQAFSSSRLVNDTVGGILHLGLLTPYFTWAVSHSMHHRNTGSMENDLVYVPPNKREYKEMTDTPFSFLGFLALFTGKPTDKKEKNEDDVVEDDHHWGEIPILASIAQATYMIGMLLLGFPLYLLINKTGQTYGGRWAHHFTSDSPLFNGLYRKEVWMTNIGLALSIASSAYVAHLTSFRTVAVYYIGPVLVVNAWFVLITYLHHTDPRLPHYTSKAWTFVRGALATIDRSYGPIINHLHHHVADAHVVHHLFSKMPHYNTVEATRILKPLLGPHYYYDDTFFLKSFWNSFTKCVYVPDEGDVLYYEKIR